MATNADIKVGITTDLSNLLNGLNQATKSVKDASDKMASSFTSVEGALNSLKGPVMTLVSLFGGGALFGKAITDTTTFSKEVGKLANVMGTTTTKATILSVAIGDIYGDSDTFMSMASKFTKALAADEQRITQLTGVRVRDNGVLRDSSTVMLEVFQSLDKLKSGFDKNLVAQELFGKNFKEAIKYQQLSTQVMLEAEKKVNELGLAFDALAKDKVKAYRAAQNDLGDALLGFSKRVSLEVMPALTNLGNYLSKNLMSAAEALAPAIRLLVDTLSMTSVQLGIAGIGAIGLFKALGSLTIVKNVMEDFKVFSAVLKLEGASAGMANLKGMGAALYAAIGPLGAAAIAVGALAAAFEWLSKASERAAERSQAATDKVVGYIGAVKDYREALKRNLDVLNNPSATEENKKTARENLEFATATVKKYGLAAISVDELIKKSAADREGYLQAVTKGNVSAIDQRIAKIKQDMEDFRKERVRLVEALNGAPKTEEERKQRDAAIAQSKEMVGWENELKQLGEKRTEESKVEVKELTEQRLTMEQMVKDLEEYRRRKATDMGSQDPINYKLSLQEELAFWKARSNLRTIDANDRKAVGDKILAIEASLRQENFKNIEQSYNAEIIAAQGNLEEKYRITDNYYKQALRDYGAHNELTKKLAMDRNRAMEALDKDQRQAALINQKDYYDFLIQNMEAQETEVKDLEERGLISKEEAVKRTRTLAIEKMAIQLLSLQAERDALAAEKGASDSAVQALDARIARLRQAKGELENQKNSGAPNSDLQALEAFQQKMTGILTDTGAILTNVFNGIYSNLSNTFNAVLTGQMKAGNALKAIWKGLGQTIAGEISKIAAAYVAQWAVEKAIQAWKAATTPVEVGQSAAKQAAKTGEAVTNTVAENSKMGPWGWAIGIAAAIALIAFLSSVGANTDGGAAAANAEPKPYSDRGTGLQFTGRAVGGVVTKPEYTLLGEAGPEVVAPLKGFQDYSLGLMAQSFNAFQSYIGASSGAVAGMNGLSASYATAAPTGQAPPMLHLGSGNVFAEGAEKQIYNMIQSYNRKNL